MPIDRYTQSGVNIDKGDEFVRHIKEKVRSTFNNSVLADVGAFGAFYDGRFPKYQEPVLVSSVDGVGTKLKVAFLMNRHDTVGQDIVNHCVNDIAVCGADPLFFLDYFAIGKLKPAVSQNVLDGMVKACRENQCALVGGETAEMPDFYREDEYDLAGMIVGIAEKKRIFDKRKVKEGDVLLALPSTGLHTNGYSLARQVLFERYEADDYIDELQMRIGESLLTVHRSYLQAIRTVRTMRDVHGFAHITGGGIVGNVKRVIPDHCTIRIEWNRWRRPAIFSFIQKTGNIPEADMQKVFNLGVGLVIVLSKRGVEKAIEVLQQAGEAPFIIGEVVPIQNATNNSTRK